MSITHSTFTIERTYSVAPERVYGAFADPQIKQRWYADPRSYAVEGFEMDFRVGGRDTARFRFTEGPFKGTALANHTVYFDLVPNQRIAFAYSMTFGDHIMSASLVSIQILPNETGTTLIFTEQGAYFENSDGPQIREKGWNELIDRLGNAL